MLSACKARAGTGRLGCASSIQAETNSKIRQMQPTICRVKTRADFLSFSKLLVLLEGKMASHGKPNLCCWEKERWHGRNRRAARSQPVGVGFLLAKTARTRRCCRGSFFLGETQTRAGRGCIGEERGTGQQGFFLQ